MALAIALGRRHAGRTWPNPSVGAVLADPETDRIIAQGITAPGGRPHAEPLALAAAGGGAARGATLYVSLEPCSHNGRTPPCADAIVAAGVGRVVTALDDPDPRVAGQGHARIAAAGIALRTGAGRASAERAHRGHLSRVRRGRPFLTAKLARTADGYVAGPAGSERLMISGEAAIRRVHLMRARFDAVLVGIDTVLADDPRLDVRLPGMADRSPVRVVLDTRLRLPATCGLAASARLRPTWVVCGPDAEHAAERRLIDLGVAVLRCPAAPDGRLDLTAAMRLLADQGLTTVLSEAGPTLAESFAVSGLADEIVIGTSSRALGQEGGRPALGAGLAEALDRAFRRTGREVLGPDTIDCHERIACSPGS